MLPPFRGGNSSQAPNMQHPGMNRNNSMGQMGPGIPPEGEHKPPMGATGQGAMNGGQGGMNGGQGGMNGGQNGMNDGHPIRFPKNNGTMEPFAHHPPPPGFNGIYSGFLVSNIMF